MLDQYPFAILEEGIYEINEYDGASMFLVIGDERALLIDTGVGIGRLDLFLLSLIGDKPLDVFLTHNHRDHTGNAPLFPSVYISETDAHMSPMICPNTAKTSRMQFANHTRAAHPDAHYPWTQDDFCDFSEADSPFVVTVPDGYVFDLGNRSVSCWLCPGHTPGSMALIDSRTGILFAGDCCNQNVGLGVRPPMNPELRHVSVEEADLALRRLSAMSFDHARIYNGHTDFRVMGHPLEPFVLPELITLLDQIVDGNYQAERQRITMIGAEVDRAWYEHVQVQFHTENIHSKNIHQALH